MDGYWLFKHVDKQFCKKKNNKIKNKCPEIH